MSSLEICKGCNGKEYFDAVTGPECAICENNSFNGYMLICCRCKKNINKPYNFVHVVRCPICNGEGRVEWIDNLFGK